MQGVNCRYVAGVSWPRSGHHMLVNVLAAYFGQAFRHCEFHTPPNCCKSFPCADPEVTFSKSHDFGLKMPMLEGVPYLIQYRAYIPSVVSEFELHVRAGEPNTKEHFMVFASMHHVGYRSFTKKWIDNEKAPEERLVLLYEDLTGENKALKFSEAIAFFAPGHAVETDRLSHVLQTVTKNQVDNGVTAYIRGAGVTAPRDVTAFRFYDREFFRELAEKVSDL